MPELYQLYDDLGQPIKGHGASKDEVLTKGLLHAASHIWMWRKNNDTVELLLQKRGSGMRTWPNRYDISAAGHISLDETPTVAALREVQEEIGLPLKESDLRLINVHRAYLRAENGAIENEFQWLYWVQLFDEPKFVLQQLEVGELIWKSLADFKQEVHGHDAELYVPHGNLYFDTVIAAIEESDLPPYHAAPPASYP